MTGSHASYTAGHSLEFFNFIRGLIGTPWVAGGRGPKEFDCYGLVKWIQEHAFGNYLPEVGVQGQIVAENVKAFGSIPRDLGYSKTVELKHGDMLLMSQHSVPHHIGQYFNIGLHSGVIHCLEGQGTVFDSLDSLKAKGWTYYGIRRNVQHHRTE